MAAARGDLADGQDIVLPLRHRRGPLDFKCTSTSSVRSMDTTTAGWRASASCWCASPATRSTRRAAPRRSMRCGCCTTGSCAWTRRRPATGTAIGSCSRRATGRSRSTRSSRQGLLPRGVARHFMDHGGHLGLPPRPHAGPGGRGVDRVARARPGARGRRRAALRAKGRDDPRVDVLVGDAELNEGSNWEAVLIAPHLRLGNLTLLVDRQPQLDARHVAVDRAVGRLRVGRRSRSTGTTGTRSRRRAAGAHDRTPVAVVADIPPRASGDARACAPPSRGRRAELLDEDPRVALVLAEISVDGYFSRAIERHPDRAVNIGIAEQAMIGVAAGFAMEGFHPIAHSIGAFIAERPYEQLKVDFGYQGLGGTFVGIGASYDYARRGRHAPRAGGCPGDDRDPADAGARARARREVEALLRATYAGRTPRTFARARRRTPSPSTSRPGGSRSSDEAPDRPWWRSGRCSGPRSWRARAST